MPQGGKSPSEVLFLTHYFTGIPADRQAPGAEGGFPEGMYARPTHGRDLPEVCGSKCPRLLASPHLQPGPLRRTGSFDTGRPVGTGE